MKLIKHEQSETEPRRITVSKEYGQIMAVVYCDMCVKFEGQEFYYIHEITEIMNIAQNFNLFFNNINN